MTADSQRTREDGRATKTDNFTAVFLGQNPDADCKNIEHHAGAGIQIRKTRFDKITRTAFRVKSLCIIHKSFHIFLILLYKNKKRDNISLFDHINLVIIVYDLLSAFLIIGE